MVSGRIYVTEDKILCGSREGTAEQLYPHFMDLSAYTTKEELETAKEELKELIGVNAKIVDSIALRGASSSTTFTVSECDYIEIYGVLGVGSGTDIEVMSPYKTVISRGGTGYGFTLTRSSTSTAVNITFKSDGTSITVPKTYEDFHATAICYKYI